MENRDKKLDQMIQECAQGSSVEESIRKILGDDIAGHSKKITEEVERISSQVTRLQKEYAGMNIKMAVYQEIDRQCGEDCAAQFRKISELKYLTSLRNLELSKEIQIDEGQDIGFLQEALKKAYDMEQEMAENATVEELQALRVELDEVLPNDKDEIRETIKQTSEEESWDPILKDAESAASNITDQAKKDVAVLAAAAFISEHTNISDEVAAVAGWGIYSLALGVNGFLWLLLGGLEGTTILGIICSAFGYLSIASATIIVGGLVLLSAGRVAYKAIAKAAPYVKAAWDKCRPHLERLAFQAKCAVASIMGVLADKVFRPVIYWASNTALPVIKEKVVYPLRRRLEGILQWLKEKKEQVVNFVKSAAAPQQAKNMDAQEEEEDFEDMGVFEDVDEFEFA